MFLVGLCSLVAQLDAVLEHQHMSCVWHSDKSLPPCESMDRNVPF